MFDTLLFINGGLSILLIGLIPLAIQLRLKKINKKEYDKLVKYFPGGGENAITKEFVSYLKNITDSDDKIQKRLKIINKLKWIYLIISFILIVIFAGR